MYETRSAGEKGERAAALDESGPGPQGEPAQGQPESRYFTSISS